MAPPASAARTAAPTPSDRLADDSCRCVPPPAAPRSVAAPTTAQPASPTPVRQSRPTAQPETAAGAASPAAASLKAASSRRAARRPAPVAPLAAAVAAELCRQQPTLAQDRPQPHPPCVAAGDQSCYWTRRAQLGFASSWSARKDALLQVYRGYRSFAMGPGLAAAQPVPERPGSSALHPQYLGTMNTRRAASCPPRGTALHP